jgi:hypothetical protein
MRKPLNVVIFSQAAGSQQYGLGQDARILETVLRSVDSSLNIKHKDPHTYVGKGTMPSVSDVHIYLEVPCRVAYPWASVNVVIPNQEWWYKDEWSWVFDEPSTTFFYRTHYAEGLFGRPGSYISWSYPPINLRAVIPTNKKRLAALYIVGGSVNKRAAAVDVINFWKPNYPELIIVLSSELSTDLPQKPNVTYKVGHLPNSEKVELQNSCLYHVTCSVAEGFGYTMAEALTYGAIPLWTDIPAYNEIWSSVLGSTGRISTIDNSELLIGKLDMGRNFTEMAFDDAMVKLLSLTDNFKNNFEIKISKFVNSMDVNFKAEFGRAWSNVEGLVRNAQPLCVPSRIKAMNEIPTVGIVTLVYNRPEWFAHAVRNIKTCDYPRDKLVWTIVDDSDGMGRVDVNVEKIKAEMPDLKVQYVSSGKRLTIGMKRNKGCLAALTAMPTVSVFAFMDDDDHYPKGSIILRVLWLLNSKKGCVYCSTLPMYDITKYISAINVPPLNLAPCKRVSEASMCFSRSFWEARNFPNDISVAEGEAFLQGRESETIEVPPEGVIVSFLHGKNSTSRRVPEQKEANGCHYGFSDEYFMMISQIAGLKA